MSQLRVSAALILLSIAGAGISASERPDRLSQPEKPTLSTGRVYDIDYGGGNSGGTQILMIESPTQELVLSTTSDTLQNVLQASWLLGHPVSVAYTGPNSGGRIVSVRLEDSSWTDAGRVERLECFASRGCDVRIHYDGKNVDLTVNDRRAQGVVFTAMAHSWPVQELSYNAQQVVTRVKVKSPPVK